MTPICHCGKPLHYRSPNVQAQVQRLIDDLGECVRVKAGGRTWLVPRHYIALHGLKGRQIEYLGFEEIQP